MKCPLTRFLGMNLFGNSPRDDVARFRNGQKQFRFLLSLCFFLQLYPFIPIVVTVQ